MIKTHKLFCAEVEKVLPIEKQKNRESLLPTRAPTRKTPTLAPPLQALGHPTCAGSSPSQVDIQTLFLQVVIILVPNMMENVYIMSIRNRTNRTRSRLTINNFFL